MQDKKKLFATLDISISGGGVTRAYKRGDELKDVRQSVLTSMLRMKQATTEKPAPTVPPTDEPPEGGK